LNSLGHKRDHDSMRNEQTAARTVPTDYDEYYNRQAKEDRRSTLAYS